MLRKVAAVCSAVFILGVAIFSFSASFAEEGKTVVLETNQGIIEVKLMPDVAPKTCENFIGLVEKGYYNNNIFYRIIKGLMVQSGDPLGTGTTGQSIWGKPFGIEVKEGVSFDRHGLVAMDNSGPDSNGSRFFITTVAIPSMNMKYTIFGEVVSGYEVVRNIEKTPVAGELFTPTIEQKIIKAYVR